MPKPRVKPETASQAGEYAARVEAAETQDKNTAKAVHTAYSSKDWDVNPRFMSEVGKESIRSQQAKMRETADNEAAQAARRAKTASKYKGAK